MKSYHEFRHYSPQMDCVASRISMVGAGNQEYFAIIRADEPGSRYRKRRQKACAAIDEAMTGGAEPGEVMLDLAAIDRAITEEIEREKALAI
jgi:hypothetical protein